MVSVAEAEKIILGHLFKPSSQRIALTDANGKILAEEIRADRELPPFNRATMDGVAIAFNSYDTGEGAFGIESVQAAGQPQQTLREPKNCIEIMTGAPLPNGTDSIVPYEDLKIENKKATILGELVIKSQNVHLKGSDAMQNDVLLNVGMKLSPSEVAVLASVGKSEVTVFNTSKSAVISTGDELVDVDQTPLPHQVRKSNSYAIVSALQEIGCNAEKFHLADNEKELKQKLELILMQYELIILSGGVSKGKFDFVPQVLESLGVKKLVHGVSQRPGKPMWFGVSSKNFVFSLTFNPVSTFMCFHRYIKPWLGKSMGAPVKTQKAILAQDFSFTPKLTYFLQSKIENEDGRLMAYPVAGGGSGDFANLKDADGFLELALGQREFKAGTVYLLYQFR